MGNGTPPRRTLPVGHPTDLTQDDSRTARGQFRAFYDRWDLVGPTALHVLEHDRASTEDLEGFQ